MINFSPIKKQENKENLLNRRTKNIKLADYFYLFLLLSFSGNPFFMSRNDAIIPKIIFAVATVFLVFVKFKKLQIPEAKHLYVFLVFFTVIFFLQYYTLGFVSFLGALFFLLKITFGYLIIATIGNNFKIVYLNTIYYISIISLIGFSLHQLGLEIPSLLTIEDTSKSIIIFTQRIGLNAERNSGIFWEPGAFACYIILGFSFFIGNIRSLIKSNKLQIIVITLALITTYSSTGFIALFTIVLYTFLHEYLKKDFVGSLPLVLFSLFLGYQVYLKAEFLGSKIDEQYELAIDRDGDFGPDRISALLFDLHYIEKHPLVGNGMDEKTRYADNPELMGEKLGHGNGFSDFLAMMGCLGFLLYSYYILRYKDKHKIIFLILIIVILQGEPLMNYPMFLTIPFIALFNEKKMLTGQLKAQKV